jgi:hypothetical protein
MVGTCTRVSVCFETAAKFDEDQSMVMGGGRVDITEGGLLVSSTGSGNSVVFLTHGGFTRGKVCLLQCCRVCRRV